VNNIDHRVHIRPLEGPHDFEGVPPEKIMARKATDVHLRKLYNKKDVQGKLSWTLAFWATPEYAAEADMSLQEYWDQIISACYLEDDDPIETWKQTLVEIERVQAKLQELPIKRLHVLAKDTDLWVTLGEKRLWLGGGGCNIPSFEIFTSPDRRYTQGCIVFNQPLFYAGVRIEGVQLVFEQGRVVEAHASKNERVLLEMIAQKNADHIGEFSMTDGRLSRITKPMCNTLFDENIGGPFGNLHIALGASYTETFEGDRSSMKPVQWKLIGFNDPDCAIHTDIITTTERIVEAELDNGKVVTIYNSGKFAV